MAMRGPLAAILFLTTAASAEVNTPPDNNLVENACQGPGLLLRQPEGADPAPLENDAKEEFASVLQSADAPPARNKHTSGKDSSTATPQPKTWLFKPLKNLDGKTDVPACAEAFSSFHKRHGSGVDAVVAPGHGRPPSPEEANLLFSRVKKRMSNINASDVESQTALSKLFDGKRSLVQISLKQDAVERQLINNRLEAGRRALRAASVDGGFDNKSAASLGPRIPIGGPDPEFLSAKGKDSVGTFRASSQNELTNTVSAGSGGGGYSSLRSKAPPDDVETPEVPSPVPGYVPVWLWDAYQVSRAKIGDTIGALGSPWNGRLKNGIALPWVGEGFKFVRYGRWGTSSMIYGLQLIAKDVNFPDSPPLQIGDISYQYGGPIRRHKSHQNGVDVDVFFAADSRGRFDADRNLLLAASAVKRMNVTNIFIDSGYKAHLARRSKAVIASLPPDRSADAGDIARALSLMSHEPGHRDHFHIRIR